MGGRDGEDDNNVMGTTRWGQRDGDDTTGTTRWGQRDGDNTTGTTRWGRHNGDDTTGRRMGTTQRGGGWEREVFFFKLGPS